MSGARAPGAPNASSGVLPPQLPNWNPKWTLEQYQKEQELFERKLLDYLRRLNNALSESVIQIVNNRIGDVLLPPSPPPPPSAAPQVVASYVGDRTFPVTGLGHIDLFNFDMAVGDWVRITALVIGHKDNTGGSPGNTSFDFQLNTARYNTTAVTLVISSNTYGIGYCEVELFAVTANLLSFHFRGSSAQLSSSIPSTVSIQTGSSIAAGEYHGMQYVSSLTGLTATLEQSNSSTAHTFDVDLAVAVKKLLP